MGHSIRPGLRTVLAALLIFIAALAAYHGTTRNLFVWDSITYLFSHESRISSLRAENLAWMLTSLEVFNWHPLTWLSWAIDYQVYGGLVSWGYHFSSNVLHALNSVLVFVLALLVFGLNSPGLKAYPLRVDNHALVAASVAALIFAVHPQHVESVAWIAERKDLLCQFFMLLALLAYVKYVTCNERAKKGWYLGTWLLFLMALSSKSMAVTFPAILLLVDVYPLRRTHWLHPILPSVQRQAWIRLVLEKVPFLLLSAGLVLLTLKSQQGAINQWPIDARLLNAFNSVFFYLGKLLLPLELSPHYTYFMQTAESLTWKALLPVLGFFAVSLLLVFLWRKGQRAWLIAWIFYLLTLSPVLGVIQVGSASAADRYAYLPTLPAYLLLGAGVLVLLKSGVQSRRYLLFLVALPVFLILTQMTRQQVQIWRSDVSLWRHAIQVEPRNIYAQLGLGQAYFLRGEYEKSVSHFERYGEYSSDQSEMLGWRALNYLLLGRYEDALRDHVALGMAAESRPDMELDQDCIQYNIGWI
jgi:tetratricopeptide (TPR) repeat protein